jgi:hypothetical protein
MANSSQFSKLATLGLVALAIGCGKKDSSDPQPPSGLPGEPLPTARCAGLAPGQIVTQIEPVGPGGPAENDQILRVLRCNSAPHLSPVERTLELKTLKYFGEYSGNRDVTWIAAVSDSNKTVLAGEIRISYEPRLVVAELDAALQLVSEFGEDGFSVRDVGDRPCQISIQELRFVSERRIEVSGFSMSRGCDHRHARDRSRDSADRVSFRENFRLREPRFAPRPLPGGPGNPGTGHPPVSNGSPPRDPWRRPVGGDFTLVFEQDLQGRAWGRSLDVVYFQFGSQILDPRWVNAGAEHCVFTGSNLETIDRGDEIRFRAEQSLPNYLLARSLQGDVTLTCRQQYQPNPHPYGEWLFGKPWSAQRLSQLLPRSFARVYE